LPALIARLWVSGIPVQRNKILKICPFFTPVAHATSPSHGNVRSSFARHYWSFAVTFSNHPFKETDLIVNFTPAFMATGLIVPPGKSKIEYSVADEPGLFVECRTSARAIPTWYLRLKNPKGTNTYKKIGNVREVSLLQAKRMARQLKVEHANAPKIEAAPEPLKSDMTLDTFVKVHANPYNKMRKRSHGRDLQLYQRVGRQFGHLKLTDIQRLEVQVFHNDLVTVEGLAPATADHHVVYLRRLLNLAVQWDILTKSTLSKIPLMKVDNKVERYLSETEVKKLVDVLKADTDSGVAYVFLFLLSTGARLNEALQSKWAQVDLDKGVWRIPATNSKSKRTRAVPLNDSAKWVLNQLWTHGRHDFLFVNAATGKPWVSVTRAWYRLRAKAGIENLRIHDLRHSYASFLVNGGRSLYEVQQILGHSDPKVTMRYAHMSTKALQEAANVASMIVSKSELQAA
jgi:integrase